MAVFSVLTALVRILLAVLIKFNFLTKCCLFYKSHSSQIVFICRITTKVLKFGMCVCVCHYSDQTFFHVLQKICHDPCYMYCSSIQKGCLGICTVIKLQYSDMLEQCLLL